ncbi:prephenate dehydrogenase [Priestia koreensis]|uniref:Prephenate dehydrogenase n=1 Tax=Priestia koreensis TaxID=284581 RepID=A0A0M0KXG0_9BACI|nr:prephenate dehydrogenase [Priestia koreensis]KOO43494.1 prephenate dehydrogenase [Priestia koreensis]
MTKVLLVGVGLIGGSVALSMKKQQDIVIAGYDIHTSNLEMAKSKGIIDEMVLDVQIEAERADLIILGTPVEQTIQFMEKLAEWDLKDQAIITDVGSTKWSIMKAAERLNESGKTFIGGHPMAGSHESGAVHARADLFRGARYVLTPSAETTVAQLEMLTKWLSDTEANFITMDAKEHDQVTGVISHLPHMIAASLVRQVEEHANKNNLVRQMAAGGFRDITRIASSSPVMWRDISRQNRETLLDLLEDWMKEMQQVKQLLEKSDQQELYTYFSDAKTFRDSICI